MTTILLNIRHEDKLVLLFNDNLITIDHVENCGDNGIGTMMMILIEELASAINSKAIELIELSQIIMKIDYKLKNILLSEVKCKIT